MFLICSITQLSSFAQIKKKYFDTFFCSLNLKYHRLLKELFEYNVEDFLFFLSFLFVSLFVYLPVPYLSLLGFYGQFVLVHTKNGFYWQLLTNWIIEWREQDHLATALNLSFDGEGGLYRPRFFIDIFTQKPLLLPYP